MNETIAKEREAPAPTEGSFAEVLWVSTRLGLTSFGGPIAHLGYFHDEYVARRKRLLSLREDLALPLAKELIEQSDDPTSYYQPDRVDFEAKDKRC